MADYRELSTDPAVKLSGATALTTDAATVVALSPNSPLPFAVLTKGAQGVTGVTTQDLKDSGRVAVSFTTEFSPVAAIEALLSMSVSKDGAAAVVGVTSYAITAGKRLRITSISHFVETTAGTSIQRAYLRMRFAVTAGVVVASPLQMSIPIAAAGVVKSITTVFEDIPDGLEFLGDGTRAMGFTLQAPDYVLTTATLKVYVTVIGFEY